ncbi:MAG: heparinase II/III family protein [Bacteroidota bacterium]
MDKIQYLFCLLVSCCLLSCQSSTPVAAISLFEKELARTQVRVNGIMEQGVNVPVPQDMAGGFTHEEHKRNWSTLYDAGALFRETGEERYASFIHETLLRYAELYPDLPRHPTQRSYATGKLFWQCLNDANWLVYVSQAYDAIYDWLPPAERASLNQRLFRPMADFLSIENPQFFNRIHNHSTWGCAAVGMIGLVMEDEELVERALHGIPAANLPDDLRDDDTGLIKDKYGRAGFLPQLDLSFSPDGYFTEGPYYLRYALSPFLLFGRALAEKRPDLDILNYREGILGKAINALLLQADPTGNFFPINDSQKGMSLYSPEVVKSVDYGFFLYGENPDLLSLAMEQGTVTLDEAGKAVSEAIDAGKARPFRPISTMFTDGAAGTEGGVAVLRAYPDAERATSLLFKYAAQGMGHGHFDRLGYAYYNERGEVIQDYGSARWVNIDQKGGGRYLPENNSWAKQTVAHNTLVIDRTSHYRGDIRLAEKHHPVLYAADLDDTDGLQLLSAREVNAYPGQELQRSLWLLSDASFTTPLVIDLFRTIGETEATYDLPTWYQGQLLSTSFDYRTVKTLVPLGKDHGYQHLWQEASGKPGEGIAQVGWLGSGRFYTQTILTQAEDEIIFVRLGANDPDFNLRRDPAFILRREGKGQATFVSVLESHGSYTPRDEIPRDPYGHIERLQMLVNTPDYTVLRFNHKNGKQWTLLFANGDAAEQKEHQLNIEGQTIRWNGVHHLLKSK